MESKMNDGVKRKAYGYTRVSTDEQVPGASLENQRIAIQRYADENDIEIVGWFSDPGYSAKNANRPELQKMLEAIHSHKREIDFVIVYNVSRISRNLESFSREIGYRMASCGTTLRSTMEVIDETPVGRLMLNISLSIHQYDNDVKSQTVKDNMRLLTKQGWWMSQAPLGLKLKHVLHEGVTTPDGKKKYHNTLEIDDTDNIGENIRFLLKRFSEGDITIATSLKMAHKLGIKMKSGEPIKFNTLEGILHNPVYAGYNASSRLLDGEMVRIKDFNGLISLETFNKNQKIMKGNAKELTPSDNELYPLKRTLICSKCGKPIRASAPTTGSGKKSPRYHCCGKGHGSIGVKEMHQAFVDYLKDITPADNTVKLYKEVIKRTAALRLSNTNKELAKCREELSAIDSKLNDVLDALLEGKIGREEKERYSEAQIAKRDVVEQKILELEKVQRMSEATIDYVCNYITKPAKLWKDANLESRQAFQAAMFPNGLHFDILERKFGTDDLSPLFSVICNKKEPNADSNSEMVDLTGLEPVTLRM